MDISTIIDMCLTQNIKLECKDGKLGIKAANGAVSHDLLAQLKEHKDALIEWLQQHERNLQARAHINRIQRRTDSDPVALSFNQKRLWFLEQLEGHSVAYNIPFVLKLKESVAPEQLQQSFMALLDRHTVLRTCYLSNGPEPQARLINADTFRLAVDDLRAVPELDRQASAMQIVRAHIATKFDLTQDFMLKARLIWMAENDYFLVLCLHHIAGDAWSINILINEFVALYAQPVTAGMQPTSQLQYADYAAWEQAFLQNEELDRQLAFWRNKLERLPTIHHLPLDYTRPNSQSYRGAKVKSAITPSLKTQLVDFSRNSAASEFMVLQAAFACLLHRYSAESDIVMGTPVANRSQSELAEVVGYFANTLVLRNIFSEEQTFSQTLEQSKHYLLAAYEHQLMPFDKVVEELKPERNLSYTPIFQIMLVMQSGEQAQVDAEVLQLEAVDIDAGTAKFDLLVEIVEKDGGYSVNWTYASDLFAETTVAQLAQHFIYFLRAALNHPETAVGRLPLLAEPDLTLLRDTYNQTTVVWPQSECLHTTFERTAAQWPEAIALVDGAQQMTYQALNVRANQVAHRLREQGVNAGDHVGIHVLRSFDLFVAILAVLKVGAAYVPFDPDFPAGRLAYLLKDARPRLIISQIRIVAALEHLAVEKICLDLTTENAFWPEHNLAQLNIGTHPDQLAYILYTSGSTGEPKGVMCSHRAIASRINWMQSQYQLTPQDVMLQKTPYSFDVSLWELLWPIMFGAKVVLAEPGGHVDPVYLREKIASCGATILHLVPSMLQSMLSTQNWPQQHALRFVFCAGEVLLPNTMANFQQQNQKTTLVNRYGPTEAPAACYWPCIAPRADGKIPIGRPTSNTLVYVVDQYQQLVPRGVIGELYLGGTGLADGYLNLPELTQERFITNPFGPGRVYKTGDLVRWLTDGTLEFIGRRDSQIKLRGYRIELGEVEQALASLAEVDDAVVVVRGTPNRLIGYVKKSSQTALADDACQEQVKQQLQQRLPDYMIPSRIVFVTQWPITTSGKVDRNLLPDVSYTDEQILAPLETPTEKLLQNIWAEVLNISVTQIGAEQNFFELGGDSILSIQVVAKAAKHNLHFSVRDIFKFPRIRSLAKNISSDWTSGADQHALTGELPALPIYKRFLHQQQNLHHYNQAVMLSVPNSLTVELLVEILVLLVDRHDALRLRVNAHKALVFSIAETNAELAQCIRFCQVNSFDEQTITPIANAAQRSLNIEHGPIMQLVLFSNGQEQRLLWVIHHIAIDGVSWRILLEDLTSLWQQLHSPQQPKQALTLPEKTCSIRQWAEALALASQQDLLLAERSYWLEQNRLVQQLSAPKNPAEKNNWGSEQLLLSTDLTERLLGRASAAYGSKINELLLSAWFLALHSWSGNNTASLTLESHGRDTNLVDLDISQTLGWFTTHYPFSYHLESTELAELIPAVIAAYRAVPNNGLGYGLLTHMAQDEQKIIENLPDVVFNYLGQFDQLLAHQNGFDFSSEPMGDFIAPDYQERFCISFTSLVLGGQLRINMNYDQVHLSSVRAQQLMLNLSEAIEAVVIHCCEKAANPILQLAPIPVFPVVRYLINNQHWMTHFNTYDFYSYHPDQVDLTILEKTLTNVVDAHSGLRVRIHYEQNEVTQFLAPPGQACSVIRHDLSHLNSAEALMRMTALANDEQRQFVFHKNSPLYRFISFSLPEAMGNRLLLIFHHMIVDGDSRAIIRERLLEEYRILLGENSLSNSPLPGTYSDRVLARNSSDYVEWLRGFYNRFSEDTAATELAYWRTLTWPALARVTHLKTQAQYETLQGAAEQLEFELANAQQVELLAKVKGRAGKALLFDILLFAELKALEPLLSGPRLLVETVNDNRAPSQCYPSADGLIGNTTSNDVFLVDLEKLNGMPVLEALEELQQQRMAQQGLRQSSLMALVFGDNASHVTENVEHYLPWVGINLFINWGQTAAPESPSATIFEWASEYGGDKESRSLVGVRGHAFFVHIEMCNEGLIARLHPDLCRLQNEKVKQVLTEMRALLRTILVTDTASAAHHE